MKPDIQIYSPKGSKAFLYVLDFVFYEFYKTGFEWIENLNDRRENSIFINYSDHEISHSIKILPNKYLFEANLLKVPLLEFSSWDDLPVFFASDGQVPFDIFAAIFYLLARVEEYGNQIKDKHGRFCFTHSIFDADFIQRPVIDEWLLKFKNEFLNVGGVSFPVRQFKWINTYDIDVAYAYKNRTPTRTIAAAARNIFRGDFDSFLERILVLAGRKPDPYDSYEFQESVAASANVDTIYFFLLADKSHYDRNLSYKSAGMRKLIQRLSENAAVGIHPSYASGENPERIETEKKRLTAIANKPITKSRQHFLRFHLPETYQHLIEAGIEEEFSMGYADMPGFRAGTCTPFYFFDLQRNYTTSLKIIPLAVMDASLRDYLKLNPMDGLEMVKTLIDRVRSVGGVFISLWHNDTLGYKEADKWRWVYAEMANYLKKSYT